MAFIITCSFLWFYICKSINVSYKVTHACKLPPPPPLLLCTTFWHVIEFLMSLCTLKMNIINKLMFISQIFSFYEWDLPPKWWRTFGIRVRSNKNFNWILYRRWFRIGFRVLRKRSFNNIQTNLQWTKWYVLSFEFCRLTSSAFIYKKSVIFVQTSLSCLWTAISFVTVQVTLNFFSFRWNNM